MDTNISIKILIKKDIATDVSIDIYVNLQFLYALQNTKNFLIKKIVLVWNIKSIQNKKNTLVILKKLKKLILNKY